MAPGHFLRPAVVSGRSFFPLYVPCRAGCCYRLKTSTSAPMSAAIIAAMAGRGWGEGRSVVLRPCRPLGRCPSVLPCLSVFVRVRQCPSVLPHHWPDAAHLRDLLEFQSIRSAFRCTTHVGVPWRTRAAGQPSARKARGSLWTAEHRFHGGGGFILPDMSSRLTGFAWPSYPLLRMRINRNKCAMSVLRVTVLRRNTCAGRTAQQGCGPLFGDGSRPG
jgi:hypothetical protein